MKKYILRYTFIIGIIIFLWLIKDFQPKMVLTEFDDFVDKGIIDGHAGTFFLLSANACFAFILSIATVVTTMKKDNKVKFKYLIATAIILTLIFIFPIVKFNYFGGIDGGVGEDFLSMFSYLQRLFG